MPPIPYNKPPLLYSDQLQQLKNRRLVVENDNKALHILENISYYRLSGYWYPMLAQPKSAHVFKPNASFNKAFKLYCFDRELRQLVMTELEKIEVAVRAKMSYVMSHVHGRLWYDNPNLFKKAGLFTTAQAKILAEYNRSDEEFIKAFKANYSDPLPPCWMMLEILSFGSLSTIYSNLRPGLQKREIANYFGLDDKTFASWIHTFTYVRNVCAHHVRFWNRRLGISPKDPLTPMNPFISSMAHIKNKPSYFLLSMIIYMLNTVNPKHTFKNRLYLLLKKYPTVDVKAMGFPNNWELEPLWNWKQIESDAKPFNKFLKSIRLKK